MNTRQEKKKRELGLVLWRIWCGALLIYCLVVTAILCIDNLLFLTTVFLILLTIAGNQYLIRKGQQNEQ